MLRTILLSSSHVVSVGQEYETRVARRLGLRSLLQFDQMGWSRWGCLDGLSSLRLMVDSRVLPNVEQFELPLCVEPSLQSDHL